VAPAPTFEAAGGKAAAQIRAAQAAFKAGSYDRAVAAAQEALREDPANASARNVLDSAQAGQKALVQLRAAEAALSRGDFDAAETEVEAARRLAPWDRSVVDFSSRVAEARERARRDADAKAQAARTAQINTALNQGATALQNKQYEAAIAAYEQALLIDRGNAAAEQGRQAAIGAKAIADAAASGPRPGGKSFVAGRTEAKGAEQGGLVGFEDSAGVDVKRGTAAAELPGRILFEASPAAPKPGDRFRVGVVLLNEGQQAISLASMTIATVVDGRRQSGPVTLSVTTGAPGQRAPVYQTPDQVWKEGTQSWTMEIVLKTTKGETYRNTLSWK
jgi:tetratricopeptide (TPR) repeat protein